MSMIGPLKIIFLTFYSYCLSNDTHIDDFLAILGIFENVIELTGNDVMIPGKMVVYCGISSQIDCIVLRNLGAKFSAFSRMCTIFSPYNPTKSLVFNVNM